MLKQDLIGKNPLGILNTSKDGQPVGQRVGLVVAKPGVGKTAILVQIALDAALRGNQVLHVSIGQGIEKTKAWYDDILLDIEGGSDKENQAAIAGDVQRNRMIMTFNESTFSRPKLEERLNDLIYQDIFRPVCLVIDGLKSADLNSQLVRELKELGQAANMHVWFSAVSQDEGKELGSELTGLFDTIIALEPDGSGADSRIFLNIIKDSTGCIEPGKSLRLDPATLVVWGSTF